MAREFYCTECHEWHPVDPERGVRGSRRVHDEQHTAAAQLFSREDLLELDAMLNGFYGGGL